MPTEASDLRSGAVAPPGKSIARLRQAKVDYLEAMAELAREGREDGILGLEASFVGEHPGVSPPHVGQPVLVNVVDKALVRWLEHPEQFTQELFQRVGLVKDHRRVMAGEVDRTPPRGVGMKIYDPKIAIAVCRDRKAIRECLFELEHKIPTREIDLFDRSVETSTSAEQLRYLWRDTTR
jgi:hypothetical protein